MVAPDPPQKIWLESPPEDVPLHAGTTVRLICFCTGGNPTGTLTWFKVGVYRMNLCVCECMCVCECADLPHTLFCVTSFLPFFRPPFLLQNGRVVPDALRQTSFNRGAARELVLVLTASDNLAAYRCDAKNEAKKIISAQTRLRVHCES